MGSPFDYKNNTLLYLVTDMPEPNQPGYQRYLEEAIVDVATALGGRTMVLFTSYSQLSQTARAIEGTLAQAKITTLAQTSGSSRQLLLDQFKKDDARAVLLGTRSFWEGVRGHNRIGGQTDGTVAEIGIQLVDLCDDAVMRQTLANNAGRAGEHAVGG